MRRKDPRSEAYHRSGAGFHTRTRGAARRARQREKRRIINEQETDRG